MSKTFDKNILTLITKICDEYWLGVIVNEYIKSHPEHSDLSKHLRNEKNVDLISSKLFIEVMDEKLSEEDHEIWFGKTIRALSNKVYNGNTKFTTLLNTIRKEYNINISEIARLNGSIKYYKNYIKSNPQDINIENMIYWLKDLDKDFFHYDQNTKKDILFLIDLIPNGYKLNSNTYKEEDLNKILPHLESLYVKESNPLVLALIDDIAKKFPSNVSRILQEEENAELFNEEESIDYVYKVKLDKNMLRQYAGNNAEKLDTMYATIMRAIEDYIREKTNANRYCYGDYITYKSTNENLIKEIKEAVTQFLEYKEMLLSGAHLITKNKNNKNDYYHYMQETKELIKKTIELENKLPSKDTVSKKRKL